MKSMKVLYSYLNHTEDGSRIHRQNFVKAFRALGNTVYENPFPPSHRLAGMGRYTPWQQMRSTIGWLRKNILFSYQTIKIVIRKRPDVLLFRHPTNNLFLVAISILSFVEPVVSEINATRSFETSGRNDRLSLLMDRLSIGFSHKTFVVSEVLRQFLVNHEYRLLSDCRK